MRPPGTHLRAAPARDALAVLLAAGYVLMTLAVIRGGRGANLFPLLIAAPVPLAVYVLLRRKPLSRLQGASLGLVAVLGAAFIGAFTILTNWTLAAGIVAIGVAAVVCSRKPGLALCSLAVVTGTFGSLEAFTPFPSRKAIDVLLIGLWLGAIWGWVVAGRRRPDGPAWIWPGLALVLVYVLLSAFEILAADNVTAGMQSYRISIWYLAAALLVAYAPWPAHVRPLLLRGVVVTALAVGAYATLRWAIGPAEQERQIAMQSLNNLLNEELRPTGSFYTAKELAAWTAMAIPFCAGIALASHGRMRMVAALATIACIAGMVAADVRAGPAAAVPGVLAVLILFQLSQAFRGRRGASVVAALAITVVAGGGAYALTIGGDADSGRRYRAILEPTDDPSYQARLVKWRVAVDDIEQAPFGHGLGTSGYAQKRYGRFVNVGSIDVDNSYLKVAYEQGFPVLGLFVAAVLLTGLGLARRSVFGHDPARAGPAIAATGTLVTMLVLFWIGNYVEGIPILWGWLLVGLGIAQYAVQPNGGPSPSAEPR